MVFRDNGEYKKKTNRDQECYNCHKLAHFGHDYHQPDNRLARIGKPSIKERTDNSNNRSKLQARQRVHQAIVNANDSDNIKPFAPELVGKVCMAKELRSLDKANTWFLDSCTSQHLYNNWKLFSNTKAKSIDFIKTAGQIIQTEEIGTVTIPFIGGNTIELHNIALAPGCNSKLISLGQLHKSEITYYDNPTTIMLMKDGKVIA